MELKDTLHMPKTEFKMRGNLGVREKEMQQVWQEKNLYAEILKKNKGKKKFILLDGPPYANGDIHIGHALNKVLKDMVVRYKNMNGFYAPYRPGWDTHGLPIENALTKVNKVDRKSMPVSEFRKLCMEYAIKQVNRQKAEFLRLGVIGEYDNPYITFKKEFEYQQLLVFADMVEKGFIYKGLKPVYWSPSSESALAEAEIEYHDVKSPTIYVKMKVVSTGGDFDFENASLVIWTTTPWTIPANMAICAGENIEYVLFDSNKGRMLVGKDLFAKLIEKFALSGVKVIKTVYGSDLVNITYQHPFYSRIGRVLLGSHVTTEDGTGLVHTAPGHGLDDFLVCQGTGIETYCPVDSLGKLDATTGKRLAGLFVDDANKEVVKMLEEQGDLLSLEWITHSYPHDWRTKKPIIFRATDQWFCSIENMKDDMLKAIDDTKWYPEWGKLRLSNMVKDRKEWCISRQRVWGVPIPAFYAENKAAILDPKIIRHVAKLVRESGTNIWFEKSAKELLPAGYTNVNSPNGNFTKETDIMDVWFDSGTSYMEGQPSGESGQCDLYLEGFDQFRGWFNSSLSTSVAVNGKAPYKEVVAHGFVFDGNGHKMSKSLGNGVDPTKVANKMGADIIRLWVASVAYDQDVRIGDEILKQVSESYRKIRNTFRFMLGNLSDFDYKKDKVAYEKLNRVDKYMLYKTNELVKEVINNYEKYDFNDIYKTINNFINKDLSSFYLDFTKDILYIDLEKSPERRATQTVYYEVLLSLIKLLTPIIPHTADEAYDYMPNKETWNSQLLDMPEIKSYQLDEEFSSFMKVRDYVLKALENARDQKIIGKSFEAHLILYPDAKMKEVLENIENLRQILIVSKLEISSGEGEYKFDGISIDVKKASGVVCARCRRIVDEVNDEGICERCHFIVEDMK